MIKHLCSKAVVMSYPIMCGFILRALVGNKRREYLVHLFVRHGSIEFLTEFLHADSPDRYADTVHSLDDITHLDTMSVCCMEYGILPVGRGKRYYCLSRTVYGREFNRLVKHRNRYNSESCISSHTAHEIVGDKVYLELTVTVSAHKVAYPDYHSVKAVILNSLEQYLFSLELSICIFVVKVLTEIQLVLIYLFIRTELSDSTRTGNTYGRYLNKTAFCFKTKVDQVFNTMPVDSVKGIVLYEMLDAGCTVDDGSEVK